MLETFHTITFYGNEDGGEEEASGRVDFPHDYVLRKPSCRLAGEGTSTRPFPHDYVLRKHQSTISSKGWGMSLSTRLRSTET
ncbi:hypothetical protein PYCH_00340 [Pyrococcus yayanosii CH1]|uniref:Uncharacterized protein n=1 Tax=Pyrococcus yayanosii (strain CH1 / JCM 16557) TaxID=529709 RepID=F8AFE0_PYRYC|nr:hypothetical protein PYCH_00340 [Pyrococcus yayanosii CH1]